MNRSKIFFNTKNYVTTSDSGTSDEDEDDDNFENDDKVCSSTITEESKRLYEAQYKKFKDWCLEVNKHEIDEDLVLTYFKKLSEKYVATTLWTTYSKLNFMLKSNENIDISRFREVQNYLKRRGKRHSVKKTKVFTMDQVSTFLNTAPDDEFLLHKVALVIGIQGSLRIKDLLTVTIDNVKQQGLLYQFCIPATAKNKKKTNKSFVTSEEVQPILDKYIKLYPKGMSRFLVQFRNKKCTRQHVGKSKLTAIVQDIAKFLNLPDIHQYTGHCYKRTSATFLVNKGTDMLNNLTSSTISENYINESDLNKKKDKLIPISMNFERSSETESSNALLEGNMNNKSVSSLKVIKLSELQEKQYNVIMQDECEEVCVSEENIKMSFRNEQKEESKVDIEEKDRIRRLEEKNDRLREMLNGLKASDVDKEREIRLLRTDLDKQKKRTEALEKKVEDLLEECGRTRKELSHIKRDNREHGCNDVQGKESFVVNTRKGAKRRREQKEDEIEEENQVQTDWNIEDEDWFKEKLKQGEEVENEEWRSNERCLIFIKSRQLE